MKTSHQLGIQKTQIYNLKIEMGNVDKRLLTKFHSPRCVKTFWCIGRAVTIANFGSSANQLIALVHYFLLRSGIKAASRNIS